ncbi:MAG TPA: hypothetical protein VFS00_09710 [Polyangiaceae bacterium]|nr:hypothetical protein [Polyangiaceae bacterium]
MTAAPRSGVGREAGGVTTGSHLGITRGGVAMRSVRDELIVPWAGPHAGVGLVLAGGADRHRAALTRGDLLAPDVRFAPRLGGEPLDAPARLRRHGHEGLRVPC